MKKVLKKLKEYLKPDTNSDKSNTIGLKDFTNYLRNNSILVIFTILILFLAHGSIIFSNNIGVDTELFLRKPDSTYNWLGIGRFGLLIEKNILGLAKFSPYYAGIIFFTFLVLSNLILYYAIYKISNKDISLLNLVIPLLVFTNPIWVEQFVYTLQYAEIAFAIFLTILSNLFIYSWIKNKNNIHVILGILTMVLSIATYQAFAGIYITICVFLFLFCYDSLKEEPIKNVLKLSISFIVGFIIYKIIVKILPQYPVYLEDSFYWSTHSIKEIIKNIYINMHDVFLGVGNYYNLGFGISVLLFVFTIIYIIKDNKKDNNLVQTIIFVLASLGLIISPFIMTIVLGHVPFIRSQLLLPFSEALIILFISYYLFKNNILKYVSIILVLCVFENQMFMMQTLYYTDMKRNEYDIKIANELMHDLKKAGAKENDKIAIIGHRKAELDATCIIGETVGLSLFDMNYLMEPYYYHSTSMMLHFIECLGIDYDLPNNEAFVKSKEETKNMPVWPEEGSIKKVDGYYVVKFSDDIVY